MALESGFDSQNLTKPNTKWKDNQYMTVKYVYIVPFIQKCFRDYIWRGMWQLFNSSTATLYNSLVQEVRILYPPDTVQDT